MRAPDQVTLAHDAAVVQLMLADGRLTPKKTLQSADAWAPTRKVNGKQSAVSSARMRAAHSGVQCGTASASITTRCDTQPHTSMTTSSRRFRYLRPAVPGCVTSHHAAQGHSLLAASLEIKELQRHALNTGYDVLQQRTETCPFHDAGSRCTVRPPKPQQLSGGHSTSHQRWQKMATQRAASTATAATALAAGTNWKACSEGRTSRATSSVKHTTKMHMSHCRVHGAQRVSGTGKND